MRFGLWVSSFETPAAPAPQDEENLAGAYAAFFLAAGRSVRTPMMSLSFMMSQFLTVELDLVARPLAEQHAGRRPLRSIGISLPASSRPPRTNGGDFALRGLFLGGISGMMMPPAVFVFGINAFDPRRGRGADGISCDPPWLL